MKNIIITITFVVMTIMTLFIVESLHAKEYRTVELSEAVDNALIATMNNVTVNKCYTIGSNEEFVEDFKQILMTSIDSTSELDIEVLNTDYEKGILSVKVTENYDYLNGRQGTVTKTATVLLDQKQQEKNYYTVKYYVGDSLYKCYQLAEGVAIIVPKNPEFEGMSFVCWKNENGDVVDMSDGGTILESNMELYAVFQ